MVDENGPHYFVAFQTPGPNWVKGIKYNEQPEFMSHVGYMIELQDKGLTVLSGPFMEKAGGLERRARRRRHDDLQGRRSRRSHQDRHGRPNGEVRHAERRGEG